MKEVVSCERMKQLDAYTIEKRGIPSCVLMERAALKTVEEMEKVFHKNNTEEKILCVCRRRRRNCHCPDPFSSWISG